MVSKLHLGPGQDQLLVEQGALFNSDLNQCMQ